MKSKDFNWDLVTVHTFWGVYTIQQTSSKLPGNVFKIHVLMLNVCWKFTERLLDCVNTLLPVTVLLVNWITTSSEAVRSVF